MFCNPKHICFRSDDWKVMSEKWLKALIVSDLQTVRQNRLFWLLWATAPPQPFRAITDVKIPRPNPPILTIQTSGLIFSLFKILKLHKFINWYYKTICFITKHDELEYAQSLSFFKLITNQNEYILSKMN